VPLRLGWNLVQEGRFDLEAEVRLAEISTTLLSGLE
jgi:hypothetical protein